MSMKSLQGRLTPGSRDECRTAPDGRRPLDQAHRLSHWPACRQLRNYIHHRHLLLPSPKADTHFTIPQRVEGWVDLDGWLHVYTQTVYLPVSSHPSK